MPRCRIPQHVFLGLLAVLSAGSLMAAELKPTATGKATGLIPRKVLFGNPDKASARISPDGKRLSFLAPVNGVLNVWVGPIDDAAAAKPVTKDKLRGIRSYFWAYTSQHLLYVQDVGGDENNHVYRVDLESGETKDLTDFKEVAAQIDSVSHRFPEEILVGLNDRDPQYHDLYRMNIITGKKTLLQKNTEFQGFVTDEDFQVRFADKFTPDGGTVMLKPDGKGGWTEGITVPMEDSLTTSAAGFDSTGKILYLIDSRGRDTGALTSIDLKSMKQKVIAENPLADCGGILAHPTENTIQAVAFTYEKTHWTFFDKAVEADFAELKKVADGELTIASRTMDDSTWIVAFLMDNGPVRYYVYDRGTKKAKFLFTNRKELEGLPLQKMHARVIESRDGLKLVSYLTLPPGTDPDGDGVPDKPLPMVLNVHGGPWSRDAWGFDAEHQLYANRGYAVLSVNFRGSTGFGKKFLNAGNKEWAGKMHNDLLDACEWAVNEKVADTKKIAILGGSYGGYATLVGLTITPERFACGVDIVGPSNIVTLLNTIPPYWVSGLQMFKDRVGDHTTAEGKKFLNQVSPLSHVSKIRKPLLIGQGANDPRVKKSEADQIVKAMQSAKIPVTYVLFPDEGHGFARPPNSLAFQAVTEAFLAVQLGGRFEALGDALNGSSITVPTGADGVPGLSAGLSKKVPTSEEAPPPAK